MSLIAREVHPNPESHPYVAFRTDPRKDHTHLHHELEWTEDTGPMPREIRLYDPLKDASASSNEQCPLQFRLGVSHRLHKTTSSATGMVPVAPPVIVPILPSHGPGRQVLIAHHYEHLDLFTPRGSDVLATTTTSGSQSSATIQEGLRQHADFPMLFESSFFLTSPIVMDVNGDGALDAVLVDYDGGIYTVGLQTSRERYFHRAQVPRLFVRREWVTSRLNETAGIVANAADANHPDQDSSSASQNKTHNEEEREGEDEPYPSSPNDPYHSYFEYSYGGLNTKSGDVLRGISANVLAQDSENAQELLERRKAASGSKTAEEEKADEKQDSEPRRRLLQEEEEEEENSENEESPGGGGEDYGEEDGEASADIGSMGDDDAFQYDEGHMDPSGEYRDDDYAGEGRYYHGDDEYPRIDDQFPGYDDYYSGRYDAEHEEYFDEKHYVRLPPHILCDPVVAELPKLYGNTGEMEEYMYLAVSYYLDEDEYEGCFGNYKRFDEVTDYGDETEVQRGMYVANGIMAYQLGKSPRWGRQEHLDMSTDHTAPINSTLVASVPLLEDNSKMGAFALSSPTIADIDGDGELEVIIATTMGFVYVFDARNLFKREGWPVQFQNPIESRVVVEDVQGDTNLELFVADTSGNIVCLDHKGNKLWHRDLLKSVSENTKEAYVRASSPMILGDVNGDGVLDIVVVLRIKFPNRASSHFIFALSADTGAHLKHFPMRISTADQDQIDAEVKEEQEGVTLVNEALPSPLLVDLHADQSFLNDYLRRNGTKWTQRSPSNNSPAPHGGNGAGLHIVQPMGNRLIFVEAGTGCTLSSSYGDEILTMVQADDVHGTNSLDLVVSTAGGNIITLESVSPFHPLNTWNHGNVRGRTNSFAHGYSASQGIFVHDVSRQYRDIFGVYVPVTFEIFDNRPGIRNEPDKRVYKVDIRDGTSGSRVLLRKEYNDVGVFTERVYIPYGPGYYTLSVLLKTSHGLVYEDVFHLGYNVNYMDGFGILLWLPLLLATVCIFLCGVEKTGHWDDDDFDSTGTQDRRSSQQGILGGPLPE